MSSHRKTQAFVLHDLWLPFEWADPAGIVFFGRAFSLAHQVFERFVVEELQISWVDWFQNPEWVAPVKEAFCSYHKPLYAGQRCTATLSLLEIRPRSLEVQVICVQDLQTAWEARWVIVFCSQPNLKKITIPSSIQSKLSLQS